jgi:hypothetical protein
MSQSSARYTSALSPSNINNVTGDRADFVRVVVGERLSVHSGRLNLKGIPTSSAGLASGDVWSNAGILTIVP